MNKTLIVAFLLVATLFSCNNNEKQSKTNNSTADKEIVMKYAKYFKIYKSGDGFKINILDRNKVIQEFSVSKKSKDKNILKIPFTKFVATSTTHLGYIEYLNSRDGLVGFPKTNFISDSILHSRAVNGELIDLGTAESMNFEKLFELSPQVIFDFPNPISVAQKGKLAKAGMKLMMVTEFYEETALGKVEWIKLFGLLLGKEVLANKIFDEIESNFLELENTIVDKGLNPTLFSGIMYGDTWYAPGGKSFVAKFYNAAGANYVWASDSSSGSRSFSFEKVYKDAVDADYWIGVGGQESLNSLIESNSNYELFKAYRNKNVYSVYGGLTEWGANSYFEKGVLQPEVVLNDLIIIFDENSDKSKLVYHKRLK